MRILIAGAGIAGLTAALCMERAGFEVTVLERAGALKDVGAGIQLGPNACHVLTALGVAAGLDRVAVAPEHLSLRDGKTGREIFSIAANDGRWQAPYWHIHRADLINAFSDALDTTALHLDQNIVNAEFNDAAATVTTGRGDQFEADLIVAADGVHSSLRQHFASAQGPAFTGNVACRATVPLDRLGEFKPPRNATVWAGAEAHVVIYQLRGSKLANLVAVFEQPNWDATDWQTPGDRDHLRQRFAGWHQQVTTIIEATDTHYQWALLDQPPMTKPYSQRLVAIGDASHPMLPFLAQGGAMAIEDAWILAAMLKASPEESTLTRFAETRLPRVRRVYNGAKRNQLIFHQRSALGQAMLWGGMRAISKLPGQAFAKGLDWLYGYNPVSAFPLDPNKDKEQ